MSQIELDRYDSRPIRALGKCEIMMFGFKGLLHSPKIPFLIKILAFACALSPARFVLVCDACARSSVHTLGHNSWQPGGDRGNQPISVTQGTSTRSEAPREAIHALEVR